MANGKFIFTHVLKPFNLIFKTMAMKKFTMISLFVLSSFFLFCQNTNGQFPNSWEGEWFGQLSIFKDTGKVRELPMALHILPIDTASVPSWTWTIRYGEDQEAGKRPYELITVDAAKGFYLIDEKNTIKMEGYYIGGQFYQWFEVQGSRLLTKTEMVGDALVWEIVVGSDQPVSTTGGSVFEGEEIPPVKAFPISNLQRAVLRKKTGGG